MLNGASLIGALAVCADNTFQAVDPATGQRLQPPIGEAGAVQIARACALAAAAFDTYREIRLDARAAFLETIALNILSIGDSLIDRAAAESGLPRARLVGERARTISQLTMFADTVRNGEWLALTIDSVLPERQPLPRPDIRLRKVPLGPVAVFGASNFPLAFSVAGGDTASALAAGCPVVAKGHPAHPGTSELVGRAIQKAVAQCGLPQGVFSLLQGSTTALGGALVADPNIKAVGFTGSRTAGLALNDIAAARPEPIPVYAEMSSINPVLLFPHALAARAKDLAAGLVASMTAGAGQFCTNPGLVLAIAGPALEDFLAMSAEVLHATTPQVMLNSGIHTAYERGLGLFSAHAGVATVARGEMAQGRNLGQAALFVTSAKTLLDDPALTHEVFGACSLVVRCDDEVEIIRVLQMLEGQLTATMHIDALDEPFAARLLPLLERKVGRILANAWPTGVEVSHAMVHGGPFPATSDSRSTSVGSLAIERFLRPVAYQNFPNTLLPVLLRDGNPGGLTRRIDGSLMPGQS